MIGSFVSGAEAKILWYQYLSLNFLIAATKAAAVSYGFWFPSTMISSNLKQGNGSAEALN